MPLLESAPTLDSLTRAALALALLMAVVWGAGRWMEGRAWREPIPPTDRVHPPTRLVGLDLFVAFHVAWVVAVPLAGGSLTPLLTHLVSLVAVANLAVVLLAAALWRRSDDRSLRGFLFGGARHPRLGRTAIKPLVRRVSLLALLLLHAAFAGLQLEHYGRLSTSMVVWLFLWWGLLYPRFRHEERQLARWEMAAEPWGFAALWRELVFVPFFFSSPGWLMLDMLAEPPAWSVWAALGLYAVAWNAWCGADRQRYRYARDPHCYVWGRPAAGVADRFLCSGWFRWLRRPDDVAELILMVCVARGVGAASPWLYLLPGVLALYMLWRARNEERYLLEIWGPDWERYLKRVRGRWIPGLF